MHSRNKRWTQIVSELMLQRPAVTFFVMANTSTKINATLHQKYFVRNTLYEILRTYYQLIIGIPVGICIRLLTLFESGFCILHLVWKCENSVAETQQRSKRRSHELLLGGRDHCVALTIVDDEYPAVSRVMWQRAWSDGVGELYLVSVTS